MDIKQQIEKSKLFLVEGVDEVKFFNCLFKHLERDDIQIIDTKGKDKLKLYLPLIRNITNFSQVDTIAVVRDADNSIQDAFNSVSRILTNNQISPPNAINTVQKTGTYNVGVFIMPGTHGNGMLETLVMESLEHCTVKQFADRYITELSAALGAQQSPKNMHKAKMHAYLAGKREYVPSLGMATEKGYFDLSAPAFNSIREFVNAL